MTYNGHLPLEVIGEIYQWDIVSDRPIVELTTFTLVEVSQ